jgi:acyl dehydratase
MPKRYFDEIEVGESFETPGITVTDWHVLQFAGVSMDFFELHTNDEFARQTEFGRRVAHGLLGLALTRLRRSCASQKSALRNRSPTAASSPSSWSCETTMERSFRRVRTGSW